LDLSAPAAPASSSLDLSAPAAPTAPLPPTGGSTSLELGGPPSPAAAGPAPASSPGATAAPSHRQPERIGPGGREILSPRNPTITLNRVQSGIGTLTIDAVCSPAVGDLRLGALYELADGTTSLVRAATGVPTAPPGSRRPVLQGARPEYERLIVDLRQSRGLRRLLVYAFSESGSELSWAGTLRITTFGGAHIEVPMDVGPHRGPLALLSLYNIDGEFVLRAELEKVAGAAREVARSYGYDQISWADDDTPVV
jgi:uncharacterized protein involved in tellurium resistance